ncbi:hypothetical protein LCGC14_2950110, partial [marine sediment metagenome]
MLRGRFKRIVARRNHGTATLLNNNTTVTVTHGLGKTPTVV